MSDRDVRVSVDAGKRSALRRIWRYVGYDEPNYSYSSSGRELLDKLGTMGDGPYYVRCHFMLCTGDGTARPKWGSTNAYTEDGEGRPVYFFDIVDRILDAQIASGCIPFLELGFMPKALTTAPAGVPYEEIRDAGWAYPPKDYSRWADLIRALARHCLSRYGLREVSRWYWELWNEPDIFYWKGSTEEYSRLFDFTESALHSVLPQARLGGPAVTGPHEPRAAAFLKSFLEHCVHGENASTGKQGTRLDLLTFHVKGGGYRVDHNAPKETPTMGRLLDHVRSGLEVIAEFPELEGVEVNLSECDPDGWAAGGKHDNPNLNFRNTEYYSSYVANTVCRLVDLKAEGPNRIDGMLTWAFQFEGREYFEGLRTLSTNGIDKAVLNVFRLLAKLGGARLGLTLDGAPTGASRNFSAIAAHNETGDVQLFFSDHDDDWDAANRQGIAVSIKGLPPGRRYAVREWVVDRDHANAYAAWVAIGSPQEPTADQLEQLRRASMVRAAEITPVVADSSGRVSIALSVDTHGVSLVELVPSDG